MSHKCHAVGCETPVNRSMLMCSKHWVMVPTMMQVKVKTHFNPAQCKGHHVRPSREWLLAARQAITYVAKREGRLFIDTQHESTEEK